MPLPFRSYCPGDRVFLIGFANSFSGRRGTVVSLQPCLMVLVDGETHPMRFSDREIASIEEREVSMTGAE